MRVATSNKEPHCSIIIAKTTKEPCLIVGVLYCKFIVLLYCCNEIVLVSITIWFQTRGTRKFDESSRGYKWVERLRTTNLYNIGFQTFSDGTSFVGPMLSPTKSHSIISLANGFDTMQHQRNGCYSSSNNPNGIWNQIKSIQNWNTIISNISPTYLNWKKMEALLTVIWRYTQSTFKI